MTLRTLLSLLLNKEEHQKYQYENYLSFQQTIDSLFLFTSGGEIINKNGVNHELGQKSQ
ncbi:hypothetical protein RintRC_0980 [Richelia intracellularis]|nr:hypothetical protein RintRC_0980 [Richelia intracellularis]